jgi:hypothetical protein
LIRVSVVVSVLPERSPPERCTEGKEPPVVSITFWCVVSMFVFMISLETKHKSVSVAVSRSLAGTRAGGYQRSINSPESP